MTVLLVGCENSKQSSSSGATQEGELSLIENYLPEGSGELVNVAYDVQNTVGAVVTVNVRLRDANNNPTSGTLYWGDSDESQVFDNMNTSHIYHTANTYTLAVQPDGGNRVDVGEIVIIPETEDYEIYIFNSNPYEWTDSERQDAKRTGLQLACVFKDIDSMDLNCIQGRDLDYSTEFRVLGLAHYEESKQAIRP